MALKISAYAQHLGIFCTGIVIYAKAFSLFFGIFSALSMFSGAGFLY